MKILFDLHCTQAYGETKFHGGGTYGRNLFIVLINQITNGLFPVSMLNEIVVTKKFGIAFDIELAQILSETGIKIIEINNVKEVAEYIFANSPDFFYSPLPEPYIPFLTKENRGATKFLGTIHGLRDFEIHYTKKYVSYQRKFLSRLRQRSREFLRSSYLSGLLNSYRELFLVMDGFLTVSEHTKHQILLYFPEIKADSIKVIFPIQIPAAKKGKGVFDLDRFQLEKNKYFLMLNCNRPVKNVFMLLDALDSFFRPEFSRFKYACIGFNEYQKKLIRKRYKRIYPYISFIDYVQTDTLEFLHENSFSFIFPSLSEGFGYPPLDAMRLGIPVLASGLSAVPEVCSDAALYFDPNDKSEIANRVLQLILDDNLRASLINKGSARYAVYKNLSDNQLKQIPVFFNNK